MHDQPSGYRKLSVFLAIITLFGLIAGFVYSSGNQMPTRRNKVSRIRFQVPENTSARLSVLPSAPVICVSCRGRKTQMDLETYVCLCTAAEMPVSYPQEALSAQAVCARTLVYYKMENGAVHKDGSLICDSSSHCQALTTIDELRDKWGDDFDDYWEKIKASVGAVRGLILTCDSHPIEVFYHASSNGYTEDASAVFACSRSYLIPVESEEAVEKTYSEFTLSQCRETLKEKIGAIPSDSDWKHMKVLRYTPSHRVDTVQIGETVVGGVEFRHAFNLKSTDFSWTWNGDTVTFECLGYGHGVGMSQRGAQAMARNGSDFQSILAHYYPGTSLEEAPEKFE